ncbi:phage portal protein [Variibacter gotjawalensis]|uniref:Phage portal protein n=1 Tax=Variibacter gotjawalensis TaxID=1333996 RepID=A0A0S3PZ69_9BRAD|nr:phage portal protein [Variibacter gotjawalensis]NIK47075.1 HK97 family phage portal protein [Variibacter gotjawalensis]RZS48977.1 HK97 family phage portal protein [Variibacter gotjawalensis]BAT61237.1 phage portal protein [Variibacter gotjawalensis]
MLKRLRSLLRAPEEKASRVSNLIALGQLGKARWTPRDYTLLTREGYVKNAIVHRAVKLVAESAASLPWLAHVDAVENAEHPLLTLLAAPNARQNGAGLMEIAYTHLLLAGNAYLEAVAVGDTVRELYALRPDRVRVVPGSDGWPEAYEYAVSGRTIRMSQADGPVAPILQLTLTNPLDDHYGLSPLEAAAYALDTHNASAKWNKALLDNAARPSGALIYSRSDGTTLSEAQFTRLKEELETSYQGSTNAGRPMLLEGGLDFKSMSLTPKDMDFLEARNAAAREIALAFGVPPMLLGIPGDNTYSNYQEANRSFWRQTVLPLAARTGAAISQWLEPVYGAVALTIDADRVDALSVDRAAAWQRLSDASFLTINEKREALGYTPIEGGDRLA